MQKEGSDKSSNLNASSLIDLKAELYRKQEEFKVQKLQNQSAGCIKGKPSASNTKKVNIFSRKNAGVSQRAEKDFVEKQEEEDAFDKSKKALEAKARLYEKISSGTDIPEEDGSGLFLVDFQKKVIDEVEDRRYKERKDRERKDREEEEKREAEEDRKLLLEPRPEAASLDEEWVDYVDSFGRSKRCLKKDLPEQEHQNVFGQTRDQVDVNSTLLSADMKREIERQKWEEMERETVEREKEGPIHYADVQHNEIRTHGVGFYKFNKDEDARQEQMDNLLKMREQTKDERSKRDKIKEKRKAALTARLEKVKQRKREKMGGVEPEVEDTSVSDDKGVAKQTSPAPVQPLTRDDTWRDTTSSTRDWDVGKHRTPERSEQLWMEKQREEREQEFAPPSFYYDTNKTTRKQASNRHRSGATDHTKQASNTEASQKTSESDNYKISGTASSEIKKDSKVQSVDAKYISTQTEDTVEKMLHKLRQEMDQSSADINISNIASNPPAFNMNDYSHLLLSNPPPPPPTEENSSVADDNAEILPTIPSTGYSKSFPVQHTPSMLYAMPNDPMVCLNTSMPPLNINIPPPNVNLLPPNINILPQNVNIPPPNLNIPPPNFNVPPPAITAPLQIFNSHNPNVSQAPPSSVTQDTNSSHNAPPTSAVGGNQTSQSSVPARTKFVPKMSIIDTRLMVNEDE